jgi:hypothetical protein
MRFRRIALIRIGISVVLCGALALTYSQTHPEFTSNTTVRTLGDDGIPAVQAVQADSFVDSLGIGIHYMWSPRPQAEVEAAFSELGIRYLRDDLTVSYDTYLAQGSHWIDRLQSLKRLGVSSLVISHIINTPPSEVLRYIHAANDAQPGTIYAVDGPNEVDYECAPDGTTLTGNIWVECPANIWLPPTESYMQSLKSALSQDGSTHSIPLYSPSINSDHFGLKSTVKDSSDFANLHYYPIYGTGYGTDTLAIERAGAAQFYGPTKPVVMTEVGYPSVSLDQNRPSTETSQAKVLPTYYLEAFHEGVSRTFIYQLLDASAHNDDWGLIDVNGRKKQSYYSIKNLISTLKDPGSAFTPGTLRYQVSGSTEVASQLFQKRDGTYYIALWQPRNSSTPAPLANDEASRLQTISLTFGSSVTTADLINVAPTSLQAGVTISTKDTSYTNPVTLANLKIGDDPILIRVHVADEPTPSPTAGAPTPTPSQNSKVTFTPPKQKRTSTQPTPTPVPSTESTPEPTVLPTPLDPSFEHSAFNSLVGYLARLLQHLTESLKNHL